MIRTNKRRRITASFIIVAFYYVLLVLLQQNHCKNGLVTATIDESDNEIHNNNENDNILYDNHPDSSIDEEEQEEVSTIIENQETNDNNNRDEEVSQVVTNENEDNTENTHGKTISSLLSESGKTQEQNTEDRMQLEEDKNNGADTTSTVSNSESGVHVADGQTNQQFVDDETKLGPVLKNRYHTATLFIDPSNNAHYGTDISWPTQHNILPNENDLLLTDNDGDNIVDTTIQQQQQQNQQNLLLSQQQLDLYIKYMDGCYNKYGITICHRLEKERISTNLQQPQYQRNFSDSGYRKSKLSKTLFIQLHDLWFRNKNNYQYKSKEYYNKLIDLNHWDVPTHSIPIPSSLVVSSYNKKDASNRQGTRKGSSVSLIDFVQNKIEEWIHPVVRPIIPVVSSSSNVIRMYSNGTIIPPHLSRLPMVFTAIINIAQDAIVDNWVYELIDHSGVARNVTIQPGEILLYESHSIISGRPFPLHGKQYANIYLYFEPIGYSYEYEQRRKQQQKQQKQTQSTPDENIQQEANDNNQKGAKTRKELFEASFRKYTSSQSTSKEQHHAKKSSTAKYSPRLPIYIEEGSIEAQRWLQDYVFYRDENNRIDDALNSNFHAQFQQQYYHSGNKQATIGSSAGKSKSDGKRGSSSSAASSGVTSAHVLAAHGDVNRLKEIAKKNPKSLNLADSNGWKPIHEAARSGHIDAVEFLLKTIPNADVNERTNGGSGGSPLYWAEAELQPNHPIIAYLRQRGGVAIAPDYVADELSNNKKVDKTKSNKEDESNE